MEDYVKKNELLQEIDDLDEDSVYIISKNKSRKDVIPAPYTLMGNGKTNKHTGIASLDVVSVFMELNKGEMSVVQKFRDAIIRNSINGEYNPNIVQVKDLADWTDYEKMALSKNYLHLEAIGVLVRIQRGKYMVNPLLVLPSKHASEIIDVWNTLKESNESK